MGTVTEQQKDDAGLAIAMLAGALLGALAVVAFFGV